MLNELYIFANPVQVALFKSKMLKFTLLYTI